MSVDPVDYHVRFVPSANPEPASFWKKAAAVFCSFLLMGAPTGVSAAGAQPYERVLTGRTRRFASFPPGLAQFHQNGVVATANGRGICLIKGEVPAESECQRRVKETEEFYRDYVRDVYEEIVATPDRFRGLGKGAGTLEGDATYFGINPNFLRNQRAAHAYLQRRILKNPQAFFALSEDKMLNMLQQLHARFWRDQSPSAGKFRTKRGYVTQIPYKTDPFEPLLETLEKKGGTDDEQRDLKQAIQKITDARNFHDAYPKFTTEERRVFAKVAYVAPSPERIEPMLKELIRELKDLGPKILSGEVDAREVAARVHQEIGRIHPFEDGNGHLARALMQTMLRLGGYPVVVIPDDEAYTEAVIKDGRRPGAFLEYLDGLYRWKAAHQEELGDYGLTEVTIEELEDPVGGCWGTST